MSWNNQYERQKKIWGEGPSELAVLTLKYLQEKGFASKNQSMLDVGCGYGRDSFYLREKLGCMVTGIDTSSRAIEMANSSHAMLHDEHVRFLCENFMETEVKHYDIIFASNFYHLLQRDERTQFRAKVTEGLKRGGLFFLSTLSISDPEHYGKGIPPFHEPHSFYEKMYLHFCTLEELHEDFQFLEIKNLSEHEYFEYRIQGEIHHHILWILIGKHPMEREI